MYRKNAEKLLEFIKKSPSAFQAVEQMKLQRRMRVGEVMGDDYHHDDMEDDHMDDDWE